MEDYEINMDDSTANGETENPDALEPLKAAESLRQANTANLEKKKWTLMFFFASDTLSPSTLLQIQAIKAAGSHVDTNVLVYFDSNEMGAPTRVLEINKDQAARIASDGKSDYLVIPILSSDYVPPDEIRKRGPQSKVFAYSLEFGVDALQAPTALQHFLSFCGEAYPAEHYMLFLVGHGLVVGRDAFLPDDNPDSAIGLKTLGKILNEFKTEIGKKLELIGMHSCSMSAIEVAYELKDTAKYMLASQGLSFVGSWPYRKLLTKIYQDINQPDGVKIDELVRHLHTLCIHQSVDFMQAGYSSDMCLCSLEEDRLEALTKPISELSKALQAGMMDFRYRDLIVLAHWRSQSYWRETYTDLRDFCLCLIRLCKDPVSVSLGEGMSFDRRETDAKRIAIIRACEAVIDILKPETDSQAKGPVLCVDYVGPDTQFSHGLSIYFPWADPGEDENDMVFANYEAYAFTSKLTVEETWLKFLHTYFDKTKRPDRLSEEHRSGDLTSKFRNADFLTLIHHAQRRDFFPTAVLEGKISPPDSTGDSCSCTSLKNYSRVFSMSPGAATVFHNTKLKTKSARGRQTDQTKGPSPVD